MKRSLLFLACVFIAVFSFSQELVYKTEKTSNAYVTKKYQVLKQDKNVKCGEYFLFYRENTIIQHGFYNQDKKDSIWSFFSARDDSLYQYDYDQNKLIYFNWRNQTRMMNIKIDGEWKSGVVDSPPVSLDNEIRRFVASTIIYPFQEMKNGASGRVIISVIIDQSGSPVQFTVHTSAGKHFDQEALRVAKEIKDWYPAIYLGKPVECEYFIPVTFQSLGQIRLN